MSNYFENKELFLEPKVKQYGSHMVMSNVYKNTKTKYINIDTRFRDEYYYNDTVNSYNEAVNYTLTLPERINDIKNLTVKSIEVPITFYTISSTLNNNFFKLTYPTSSVSKMIVLDDGEYTSSSLKTAINSKISALTTYDVSNVAYDVVSNKSVFNTTHSKTIQIDFAVDIDGNYDKYNFKSKLGWLLGYRNLTYTLGSSSTTSESFIDLNGSRYLYLALDEYSKSNPNSFITPLPKSLINKPIIARIAMDKTIHGFGTVLPADIINGLLISDTRNYNGKIDIHKLNIQLLNEYGNPINLNGLDFSFCLEVEHD